MWLLTAGGEAMHTASALYSACSELHRMCCVTPDSALSVSEPWPERTPGSVNDRAHYIVAKVSFSNLKGLLALKWRSRVKLRDNLQF